MRWGDVGLEGGGVRPLTSLIMVCHGLYFDLFGSDCVYVGGHGVTLGDGCVVVELKGLGEFLVRCVS